MCYHFWRFFHINTSSTITWRRGESNPCFDDSYPRVSANVLLEGIREQGNRRGLLRMALDVITFVITSLFCCLTHFARNDIDPAWTNPTFQVRV
jgi:hypothetical protein